MKNSIKKLILPILFLLTFAFAQQAQGQETKEYVTVFITIGTYPGYVIVYPDGQLEKGEIASINMKKMELTAKPINDIFNMLAKKGYKLVSSAGDASFTNYTFEK